MKGGRRLLTVPLAPVQGSNTSKCGASAAAKAPDAEAAAGAHQKSFCTSSSQPAAMLCLRPDNSKAQQVKQTAAKAGKRQRLLVTPLLKDINSEPSAPSQAVSHVETSSKTSSSRSQHPATAVDDATMQAPSRTACGTIHPVKVADCTKSSSKSSASANKSSQHTSQHSSPLPADIQTPLHAAFITSPPAKLQMLDSDASSPAEGVGGCLLPIYGSTAPAEATPVPSSSHAGAGFTEPSTDLTAQTPPQLSHVNQHVSRPDPAFQSRLKFSRKPHMHSQTDEHCSQPANSAAQICGEHQPVAVVSDTPDRKQTGLKSLMAVQRLPAVLASSLPSVKDLAKDVKVPRAHVLIGQLPAQAISATVVSDAASSLCTRQAISSVTQHLKPELVNATTPCSSRSASIRAQDILHWTKSNDLQYVLHYTHCRLHATLPSFANGMYNDESSYTCTSHPLQCRLVTRQLEPLLKSVCDMKLAAPASISQHKRAVSTQPPIAQQGSQITKTPLKQQLSGSGVVESFSNCPGALSIKTSMQESTLHTNATYWKVAEQQREFDELLQSPEKQAEEFGKCHHEFSMSVQYLQAILGV